MSHQMAADSSMAATRAFNLSVGRSMTQYSHDRKKLLGFIFNLLVAYQVPEGPVGPQDFACQL